jgi:hypothetical protein
MISQFFDKLSADKTYLSFFHLSFKASLLASSIINLEVQITFSVDYRRIHVFSFFYEKKRDFIDHTVHYSQPLGRINDFRREVL